MEKQHGKSGKRRGGRGGGDTRGNRNLEGGGGQGDGGGRRPGGDHGKGKDSSRPGITQEQSNQPLQTAWGHGKSQPQPQTSGQPLKGAWASSQSQPQQQGIGQPSQPQPQPQAVGPPPKRAWGSGQSQPQQQGRGQPSQPQPQASTQPPKGAWGRGRLQPEQQSMGQPSQPQPQTGGQPPKEAWGSGQSQPQQQGRGQPSQPQPQASTQPPKGAWGRGQSQSQQQSMGQPSQPQPQTGGQRPKGAWGSGQSQPQQQGRGQPSQPQPQASTQPPKGAWGRGQSQPQEQSAEEIGTPPNLPCDRDNQQLETIKNVDKSTSLKSQENKMFNMSVSDLPIPRRKDLRRGGIVGQKFFVLTNMLEIKFGKQFPTMIYHYDIDIQPEKKKYLYRPAFLQALQRMYGNKTPPAVPFDGKKNAYASGKLVEDSFEVVVSDADNRQTSYTIKFKLANEIDVKWLKTVAPGLDMTNDRINGLQALNIIMNHAPVQVGVQKGRAFYSQVERNPKYLGAGLELWLGLFQSAIIGWKPFLNVDVAHKGFFKKQSLLELIRTICCENCRGRDDFVLTAAHIESYKQDIAMAIRHVRVTVRVGNEVRSKQCVQSLSTNNAHNHIFQREDERGIKASWSVYDYFRKFKNYEIQRPDLPLVILGLKSAIPLELCHIEYGQTTDSSKIIEKTTCNMIRAAATGTDERKMKINRAVQQMDHNNDRAMKQFDISINKDFAKIEARLLRPPSLKYKNNKEVRPMRGVWRPELFRIPGPLAAEKKYWTIINTDRYLNTNEVFNLASKLKTEAANLGIDMGDAKPPFKLIQSMTDLKTVLIDYKKNRFKFVIIILPENGKVTYAHTKTSAEIDIGILTQCLKSSTVKKIILKNDISTLNNILQKVNAKINGVNHTIVSKALEGKKCMLVGADVTHPSPNNPNQPSIAAVVSSQDHINHFIYNTEIRLQAGNQEMIEDLEGIMKIQLRAYKQATSYWPDKMLFFRDGVSEGFFREVILKEIPMIKKACESLRNGTNALDAAKNMCNPKLTFVVVQKRHHTRFFPMSPSESDDARKGVNVRAGTVVDTVITHPSHIDFYLLSHASIQGTSRPTKYRVLHDDNNMTEDELEELTYHLCHMFTRCTRSVSYPAPTYYAHLAAFRAKHFHDAQISRGKGGVCGKNGIDWKQEQNLIALHPEIKLTPMFFV